MNGDRPILSYSKPPPSSSGVANGLRIIGATICAFTAVAGIGILLVGAAGFWAAVFAEMPAIDRPVVLGQAAVIGALGLVIAGFSVRWFLHAVRAVRRARSEVASAAGE